MNLSLDSVWQAPRAEPAEQMRWGSSLGGARCLAGRDAALEREDYSSLTRCQMASRPALSMPGSGMR
jgi:hypothetical protein